MTTAEEIESILFSHSTPLEDLVKNIRYLTQKIAESGYTFTHKDDVVRWTKARTVGLMYVRARDKRLGELLDEEILYRALSNTSARRADERVNMIDDEGEED